MKKWDESEKEIMKITPDRERAVSMLFMVEKRMEAISLMKTNPEFATFVLEGYYESIKEMATALMYIDGYKTLSHEILVGYLEEFYTEFTDSEIFFIDEIRVLRNRIAYRGLIIDPGFMKRNETRILDIIEKIRKTLRNKLGNF